MTKIILALLLVILILNGINLWWIKNISVKESEESEVKVGLVDAILQLRESKAVQSISFIARGKIKEIEGREVTINQAGSLIKIPILPEADIFASKIGEVEPQPISFEDIKVGQEVSVFAKIERNGSWVGERINVIAMGRTGG